MTYFCFLVVETDDCRCQILVSLMDCNFAYDHFQKTRQLARGKGKIELTVDIRCIGTYGKTARSARPIGELMLHINVWKRGVGRG